MPNIDDEHKMHFALIYGAGPESLSKFLKIPQEEADNIYMRYQREQERRPLEELELPADHPIPTTVDLSILATQELNAYRIQFEGRTLRKEGEWDGMTSLIDPSGLASFDDQMPPIPGESS